MLACMDLSKLYFAVRKLNVTVNYEELIKLLYEKGETLGEDVHIKGFTVSDERNPGQKKFLSRLSELGLDLHVYPYDTTPDFSAEIATIAALSEEDNVVVVSNSSCLIRVFDLLKENGKSPTLCFFSEEVEGNWTPTLLRGGRDFVDLSDPPTKRRVTH